MADDRLGMGRAIQRRDFLNGAAVTALGLTGARAQAAALATAPQDTAGYYPPTLTGLRGNHPGSFEVAHSLRDGRFWQSAPQPEPGEDSYDLVVVGAGISGLAAAHFYRVQKPDARVLILDNHDDFGGHAKRNEFSLDGRMQLVNGGTLEIDSPRPYSAVSDGLLRTLGIEPVKLEEACAKKAVYKSLGLGRGIFFDRETFGRDALVAGVGETPWAQLLANAPLSERARADIVQLEEGREDYMPGLSSDEKKARLSRISYRDFLLHIARADPGVLPYYQGVSLDEWGVGIDAISALDIWGFGYTTAGFAGLKLKPGSAPHMGNTPSGYADGGSYLFHFPDGNASIARLLVRDLIPAAVPGSNVSDVVTARVDYTQLDRAAQNMRIRLSSIVVGARNTGATDASQGVEIAYARFGKLSRVRAGACVLAGYNMMVPYICPDMPQAQKDALHYLVKVPLVYTSVAIRNWQPLKKLGVQEVYAPRQLPHHAEAEPGHRHRRLPLRPFARRAGAAAHDPRAVPPRPG